MARTKKKSKGSELAAQTDPRAPLDSAAFLKAASPVLELLTKDLLERADGSAGIGRAMRARHAYEHAQRLTADGYDQWRRQVVVQIAAGWLLSCVFVRTLEDRGLLPQNRIAGPGAMDAQETFFAIAPYLTERDYLRAVFTELEHVPACKALFDREHNLTWRLAPSAAATKELLALFRGPDAAAPGFRFGQSSTRFLGDLYQDLSEDVRKRYALLQTPDFIEAFILDRTLEPAVEEFGLADTTVIDPTCGSGHFLLGAFERLFEKWTIAEPGGTVEGAVGKALGSVYGVDVNPYAVSIARFRLTLAAVEKLGVRGIGDVPRLEMHVVVADSLSDGAFADLATVSAGDWGAAFDFVDEAKAKAVLRRSYSAVVGNPPYITVKDEALRERYRKMYESANGKYALSAPFMERFFKLARGGGFVGQITANSFMKREFGKGLVELVLPREDVTLIVNTAGAYIPGHGTPTVLIFGRHRKPESEWVQAVLARRGEPSTPEDPANGVVWRSIRDHWGEEGFENEYVTVERVERGKLAKHPWSLEGGGAGELKALLEERCENRLRDVVESIGFASFTGADDVFIVPRGVPQRHGVPDHLVRDMIVGEGVRDWAASAAEVAICPYDLETHEALSLDVDSRFSRFMWPYRTVLENVTSFGGKTRAQEGQDWWTWYRWQRERYTASYRIAFAFVATHNHFVLDRGGKVFKQTAPIIKLPADATEDDHLALLAYLNSSTAQFWFRQVLANRGYGADSSNARVMSAPWDDFYEFAGGLLEKLPVPRLDARFVAFGRRLDQLAAARASNLTSADKSEDAAAEEETRCLGAMVRLQEELDWSTYELLGLLGNRSNEEKHERLRRLANPSWVHEAPAESTRIAPLSPTGRPFEIRLRTSEDPLARQWTESRRNVQLAFQPTLEEHELERLRLELSENGPLALIEAPEFKRPWRANVVATERAERRLAHELLAIETQLRTVANVCPQSALLRGAAVVTPETLLSESVPYAAALRYTDSGLEIHGAWLRCWELQRREDQGHRDDVAVPPRYRAADYREASFWRLRGKLDVPTERFISYPGLESKDTGEPIFGWAGWDHAQRAQALAALYVARRDDEAWTAEELLPILVGIHELVPWLRQWHSDVAPEYGQPISEFFGQWLSEECRAHQQTVDSLAAWRPKRGRQSRPTAIVGGARA